MNKRLNVVFMGTPDFGIPSLEMLYKEHNLLGIFCQPDKINGRNNEVKICPAKEFGFKNDIPVFQPETFKNNACLSILQKLNPEIIVVAAYGKILPKYVLDYPKYGCINIHGSLLPKYRGASPIQSAILNGDKETGISIIEMLEEMDAGDILYQEKLKIGTYETTEELFVRMRKLGCACLKTVLDNISRNKSNEKIKQNINDVTFAMKLTKEDGLLDFKNMSSSQIKNLVYGLNSWPSAYIISKGISYKIHRVVLGNRADKPAGTIVSVSKQGIEVACKDGKTIFITEIQKQGKKKMDSYTFSLGQRLKEGQNICDM